jgi:hypothetical protein
MPLHDALVLQLRTSAFLSAEHVADRDVAPSSATPARSGADHEPPVTSDFSGKLLFIPFSFECCLPDESILRSFFISNRNN